MSDDLEPEEREPDAMYRLPRKTIRESIDEARRALEKASEKEKNRP